MEKLYLFKDTESGEEFIVGALNLQEAKMVSKDVVRHPKYLGEMTEFEAEMSGLDQY